MVVRVVHGSGKVSPPPPDGNPDLTKAQIVELQKALLDGELAEELAHRREELRPIFRLAALPLAHLAPRQAEYRTEP